MREGGRGETERERSCFSSTMSFRCFGPKQGLICIEPSGVCFPLKRLCPPPPPHHKIQVSFKIIYYLTDKHLFKLHSIDPLHVFVLNPTVSFRSCRDYCYGYHIILQLSCSAQEGAHSSPVGCQGGQLVSNNSSCFPHKNISPDKSLLRTSVTCLPKDFMGGSSLTSPGDDKPVHS